MNEYYSGINNHTVNRADEFATNLGNGRRETGIELLEAQKERHRQYLINCGIGASVLLGGIQSSVKGSIAAEAQAEQEKIIDYFYESVVTSQNEYLGNGKVDIRLAEKGEYDEE